MQRLTLPDPPAIPDGVVGACAGEIALHQSLFDGLKELVRNV